MFKSRIWFIIIIIVIVRHKAEYNREIERERRIETEYLLGKPNEKKAYVFPA